MAKAIYLYQNIPFLSEKRETVAKTPTSVGANARAIYYLITRKFINFDEPEDEVISLTSEPDEAKKWKKVPVSGEQLIAVAPNPADGFVELRIEAWQPTWNATLTLENAVGQVVFSQKLDAETAYVQTDGFPVGVFLVRLKDASGRQLSVQKLIVAH